MAASTFFPVRLRRWSAALARRRRLARPRPGAAKGPSGPRESLSDSPPLASQRVPALRSLASIPNNLPQLSTRSSAAAQMAEVRALLAKSRLVTILAFGGIGNRARNTAWCRNPR